jgi:hypothetical protein
LKGDRDLCVSALIWPADQSSEKMGPPILNIYHVGFEQCFLSAGDDLDLEERRFKIIGSAARFRSRNALQCGNMQLLLSPLQLLPKSEGLENLTT